MSRPKTSGNAPGAARAKLQAQVERLRRKLSILEGQVETEVVRRVRRQQEETRQQFVRLYDRAPVGYLTLNHHGVIQTLNRAAIELLRCERSDLIGRSLVELVVKSDRRRFLGHLRRLARRPGRAATEVELRSPGQRSLTVQFVTIVHAAHKGTSTEFQSVMVDITQLKTVEEQLRRSEALYRAIGESIDYGVWVCAPDGRNIYASPSFLKLVGQTQEQCSNFGWGDVLHPDDAARTIAAWKECVRTGSVWDIEHRYRGVDGQYHAILARGVAVKDDQGKIQCWAGINLDISRLKQVEEQLRASERRLRLALEGGNLAAWDWHIPSGEVVWNDEHYRMLGYAVGEVSPNYRTWADRVHPEDIARAEAAIRHSMERGNDYSSEFRVVCPDGTTRWIEARGRFERDAAGKALRCYGVMLDLTGHKQAEAERERLLAELSAEKNRWQATVENILDPLTVCDAAGRVTYMNPAYERLVGRPVVAGLELKNHPDYYQIYRPDGTLYPPEELPLQKAARTGQEARQVEVVHRSAEGREFVALFNAAPLRDADGRVSGAVAVGRDITEQRRAQQALRDLNAELEQRVAAQTAEIRQASEQLARRVEDLAKANAELEAFTYSVSHDLRAPLRQVIGFVTRLEECSSGRLELEGAECVQLIQTAVGRMGKLIDDLLAFSRMGRVEMLRESVSLRSLVDQARELLQPAVAGRAIDWVIGPLPAVQGDPALLRQVFISLLDNALKFTRSRPGARIEIGSETNSAEHVIFIRDNGVGFNQRYVGKLFGVFQRLHSAREFEGTGIGLANVQRIIQRHSGRVWAEGVEGQGAAFYFALPVDRLPPDQPKMEVD